jgi:hypothetical protein
MGILNGLQREHGILQLELVASTLALALVYTSPAWPMKAPSSLQSHSSLRKSHRQSLRRF